MSEEPRVDMIGDFERRQLEALNGTTAPSPVPGAFLDRLEEARRTPSPTPWKVRSDVTTEIVDADGDSIRDRDGLLDADAALIVAAVNALPEVLRLAREGQALRTATTGVLAEVATERVRQDAKWGEQNHPDGTGGDNTRLFADMAKAKTDLAAHEGACTWRLILGEEVAEAFAETDPDALRGELVQVAAVAAQWVEAIDRRALVADTTGEA